MASNIIQKHRKASRIGLVILGLIILAGGGYFIYRQFIYKAPVQAASETLQTTTASREMELTASGTGSYVAAATSSVGFSTSGQIVEMNVKVGDKVEKDQVLAKLDSTTAQIAYDQANRTLLNLTSPASIATAETAVATAQTTLVDYQTLVYIISPTVYSYEQKLAAAEEALIIAQKEAPATPSAEKLPKWLQPRL